VSFDCPTGPKEIVRAGVDGFLIRNDTMEFALALETLIENPELRRQMGEAGFEDFRMRFSRAQVMPRWHSLIECVHGEGVASEKSSLHAGNR
jgi:glycosyltransferase involved in cell wall biosynthesis